MVPAGLHVVRHHQDRPGPPVVFVHGAPDRSKNFAHIVHMLSDLPITVYDRRGYGKSLSAGADAPGGFPQHASDLIAILDGVPSIVVGQSAGGAIAATAAVEAPELFLAIGAWEPPFVPWEWWSTAGQYERTRSWLDYPDTTVLGEDFNRLILGDERWDGLAERTKDLLRAEGAAFQADMASQLQQYMDVERYSIPTVLGAGTEFPDPRFADSQAAAALHLHAELIVFEGANHFAHLAHPVEWSRLVRRTVEVARTARPEAFA